jgi:hypothetical protein
VNLREEAACAAYEGIGAGVAGLLAGSAVATPSGAVAIEALQPGDAVLAADGEPACVTGSTRRRFLPEALARQPDAWPIRIAAGALAEGVPLQDMTLAAGQIVVAGGVVAPAAALVNGVSVVALPTDAPVTYFALRLNRRVAVRVAALACETGRCIVDGDALARFSASVAQRARQKPGRLLGHLARTGPDCAEGWALDEACPTAPVALELVEGERVLGSCLANIRRPDLEMAGLGNCGFSLRLKHSLPGGRHHLLHLRRIIDSAEVPGSPLLLPSFTPQPVWSASQPTPPQGKREQSDAEIPARQIDRLIQSLMMRRY